MNLLNYFICVRRSYKYLLLIIIAFVSEKVNAQNLLDLSQWVVGTGSTGIFNQNGSASENVREWGIGPQDERVVLWKASPEGNRDADGGWNSSPISINHQKKYRFTVWMKKTNSVTGTSYLGCESVLNLNGTANNNPYFWYGSLPQLDRWYLIVGFVHGSGDGSSISEGGIYDGITGRKEISIEDFKFSVNSQTTVHRSYLYYDRNTEDRQYFYAPRLEVVDGNEVPLEVLLGTKRQSAGETFFADNVGIKTQNTRGNALAVNGHIRAKEIKVEAQDWPDYVFADDYVLPRLKEVEGFVRKNKHLPGVPKASVAEEEGVSLGEMNKILLKKVEELTLHLIKMEDRIESQSLEIKKLKSVNK